MLQGVYRLTGNDKLCTQPFPRSLAAEVSRYAAV